MTKKEVLQKIATTQTLMNTAKNSGRQLKRLGRIADVTLARKSGNIIGNLYSAIKNNNLNAVKTYPKTNTLAKLLIGPLPVPGGTIAGAGLKLGINAMNLGNNILIKNPKLMKIFLKSLDTAKKIIPT